MIKNLSMMLVALTAISLFAAPNDKEDSIKRRNDERSDNKKIEERIDSLISQMTLAEKAGQMTQLDISVFSNFNCGKLNEQKLIDFSKKYQIGSYLNGCTDEKGWYKYSTQLQKICMENSRLKIPFIYGIDHMHGASYVKESTIFPQSFNIGATFNKDFPKQEAQVIAHESAHLGHHWIFSTLADLGLNPQWPRFYETYSEDPHLTAEMAASYVHGLQENKETTDFKQVACAKHFVGYSVPVHGGLDRTPAVISDQDLQEFHLPPFQAMIDANVQTVMINSGSINGEPVHASSHLLTTILRDQMNFKGFTVTDWEDIIFLHSEHRIAKDMKDAVYLAVNAGIDMSMTPFNLSFTDHLMELVKEGKISEERLNLSVARILRVKLQMGLFENKPQELKNRLRTAENVAQARTAAEESLVLLRNEKQTLPLNKEIKKIVLAGDNSNVKRSLCGAWTFEWQASKESLFRQEMHTVYTALKKEFPQSEIVLSSLEKIKQDATDADAIVLAVGDQPYAETPGNLINIDLSLPQQKLIEKASTTDKPLITVMIAGRPRTIGKLYEKNDAFIWAGLPGDEGA